MCSAGTLGRRASYGWLNGDAENPDFSLSHLHSTAPLEGSQTEYRHNVWYAKTRMVWLPQSEKSPRNTATRFDRIHKRHRQTDRQTHTTWWHRLCLCIASCGKNWLQTFLSQPIQTAVLQCGANIMQKVQPFEWGHAFNVDNRRNCLGMCGIDFFYFSSVFEKKLGFSLVRFG